MYLFLPLCHAIHSIFLSTRSLLLLLLKYTRILLLFLYFLISPPLDFECVFTETILACFCLAVSIVNISLLLSNSTSLPASAHIRTGLVRFGD